MEDQFGNLWHNWHKDLVAWTRDTGPKLLLILLLAFLLVRLLNFATRKVVALSEKGSGRGPVRTQQVRTLTGVIRSVGVFLIVFLTGMWVLNDVFRINIAPLLASAGIAGLAVGFGAQTLVKDYINGFFVLLEDQYNLGDTVRLSGLKGTVENLTLRRTVLRDDDGTVHIIP